MKTSNFLDIAVWDFCSASELKPLDELIRRKYTYLLKCRNTDLFSLPDDVSRQMRDRTTLLEKEVELLYATKSRITRLHELYMNATADIGDAIYQELLDLLNQIQYWRSHYESEQRECMREKEQALFWIELTQKYLRNGTAT